MSLSSHSVALCFPVLFVLAVRDVHTLVLQPYLRGSYPGQNLAGPSEQPVGRWEGASAKKVLRELLEMAVEKEKAERRLRARAENGTLFERVSAFFSARDEYGTGQKHNCFFSPMNCRVAPRGHELLPSGVLRVPVSDWMRNRIMEKHGASQKHSTRNRYRL